ncbi:prenyltransferase/squalene oxidase repeat-containing protein [Kitasatospora purpeofusca]|uniref:prenyltransferase/squalene oxidase repeat-containing protein n=1 Tax=Kitasatospora purpeofusca TaxID=67352 RepID=UPI0036BBF31E
MLAALRLTRESSPTSPDLRMVVTAQDAYGGWEGHLLATVVILLCLSRCGLATHSVQRGVAFVLAVVREVGGVPFIRNEDTWVTALAGSALADAGVSPGRLQRTARYMCRAQLADGGWGYAAGVTQADADDTAVAVKLLICCSGVEAARAAKAGVGFMLELQNSDGGFPTFVCGAPSEVEITAKCLRALMAASSDPTVVRAARRAWSWLASQQYADGGFPAEWSASPAFPVMHVCRAARSIGGLASASTVRHVTQGCAAFLASTALSDGGWPIRAGDRSSHLLSTAYSVSALAALPNPSMNLLNMGVNFLLAADGSAAVEPDSLGPRPFVYDVPALVPIYRLAAMAHAQSFGRRT